MPAHRLGRWSRPDHREAFIGHAAQRGSADDREYPTTGAGVERRAARNAAHGKRGADADHRVGGSQQHDVGTGDRVDDPGPLAVSAPMNAKLCVGIWAR